MLFRSSPGPAATSAESVDLPNTPSSLEGTETSVREQPWDRQLGREYALKMNSLSRNKLRDLQDKVNRMESYYDPAELHDYARALIDQMLISDDYNSDASSITTAITAQSRGPLALVDPVPEALPTEEAEPSTNKTMDAFAKVDTAITPTLEQWKKYRLGDWVLKGCKTCGRMVLHEPWARNKIGRAHV